jgi:hypothetical protein
LEFDHIHRFIVEADDNMFLAIKVHESIAAIQYYYYYYYLLYYIHLLLLLLLFIILYTFLQIIRNLFYVALIIDYSGACRKDEITNISIDDIEIRPDDGIYTKIKKQCVNTICN